MESNTRRGKEWEREGWGSHCYNTSLKPCYSCIFCHASQLLSRKMKMKKKKKKTASDPSKLVVLGCDSKPKKWSEKEASKDMRGRGGRTGGPAEEVLCGRQNRSPPSQLWLTSECVRCVGWRAGWMGRGGEEVGGNWRGVALTHQATVYKNKTCGQGNGTVFFIHLLPPPKGLRKQQKMTYASSLTLISLTLCFLFFFPFFLFLCSPTQPSFPRLCLSLITTFLTSCQNHCFLQ